mmetsp:Transcript_46963/g.121208  ORF Transcript_46963/g.121208 Transcript_46963/m.121208 type:complete len:405 (-) Transcript_46963:3930-5144(-)
MIHFLKEAVIPLSQLLKDNDVRVRDTTMWTLGRIVEVAPAALSEHATQVCEAFVNGLQQEPRVAAHAAWALHNVAQLMQLEEFREVIKYITQIVQNLLSASDRGDAHMKNLRNSCYEAVAYFIQCANEDAIALIEGLFEGFISRLQHAVVMVVQNQSDRDHQFQIQEQLCNIIQTAVYKVRPEVVARNADLIMELVVQVLQGRNGEIAEEALLCGGAVASALGSDFGKYVERFVPFVLKGLEEVRSGDVVAVAVGVTSEMFNAKAGMNEAILSEVCKRLASALQSIDLWREVKGAIFTTFGDIAMAVEGSFMQYVQPLFSIMENAARSSLEEVEKDEDTVAYLNNLRTGIFEGISGMLQGLRTLAPFHDAIKGFLPVFGNFMVQFAESPETDDALKKSIAGVVG